MRIFGCLAAGLATFLSLGCSTGTQVLQRVDGGSDAGATDAQSDDAAMRDGDSLDASEDDASNDASRDAPPEPDAAMPGDPPRPLSPLSTSSVSSRQPTLRWVASSDQAETRVELCTDRAMTAGCTTIDAVGRGVAPPLALAVGTWFWRLRARVGTSVGAPGPVWQFVVGFGSTLADTSWGTTPDVNGDGYADVLVGAFGTLGSPTGTIGTVQVFASGPGGLATSPTTTLRGAADRQFGWSVASAGDVDGDGFADVIVGTLSSRSSIGAAPPVSPRRPPSPSRLRTQARPRTSDAASRAPVT
jgi:hypothetical protein